MVPATFVVPTVAAILVGLLSAGTRAQSPGTPDAIVQQFKLANGVGVLIDPTPEQAAAAGRMGSWIFKVQARDAGQIRVIQETAAREGVLGKRLFVEASPRQSISMAGNTVDLILCPEKSAPPEAEMLRALRPGGVAAIGARTIVKPLPANTDSWSHPYHGPDNNTQSVDQLARWPYLTQYLAEPLFSSQPEVTVAAGGRIFKAFGHMTFRAYQNASINQLFAVSAYNGSMLWKKPLKPGFMIHRNTIIATPDTLYMGDNESCKLIDPATGEVKDEIVVPEGIADGPVWKWMAIRDGVLYALVGAAEVEAPVTKGTQTPIGGWPWGMWTGYDYSDPKTAWGFGRTLIAIELKTKKMLWHRREQEYIDSRGMAMSSGKLFYYSPGKFLCAMNTSNCQDAWRTQEAEVLDAIGPNGRAQHYLTGFSTSVYLRTDGKVLMFAGPQRRALAAVSADNGQLMWKKEGGNFQLVLREDALYALGQQGTKSYKIELASGRVLAEFAGRRACTRATGSIDSVFCRAQEGTLRWDLSNDSVNHIAPMRPACHDGVIISDGQLSWGPWICGCHLTLVGIIGLGPAGDFDFSRSADGEKQLQTLGEATVRPFKVDPQDWPVFLGDNARSRSSKVQAPVKAQQLWTSKVPGDCTPTAPVAAGGWVFVGDSRGMVHALDATGTLKWEAHTGGAIFFPPAIADGRLFVGSNDGHVYAFEAATGRALWRYRVAPAVRDISVYGQIMSTWPVAGGVVVSEGTLYAAAGISHFDGTHVCALDAATGKLKWHNNGSGALDPQVKNGISLCGPMRLVNNELSFPGGNVYPVAQFDSASGQCLNTPAGARTSKRMFLFPRSLWEPIRNASHPTTDGNVQIVPQGPAQKVVANFQAARGGRAKPWSIAAGGYNGSIVTADAWIVLGQNPDNPTQSWHVAAYRLADGSMMWKESLRATPVQWGVAIDAAGRVLVTTEDGSVICVGNKG